MTMLPTHQFTVRANRRGNQIVARRLVSHDCGGKSQLAWASRDLCDPQYAAPTVESKLNPFGAIDIRSVGVVDANTVDATEAKVNSLKDFITRFRAVEGRIF